MTRTVPSVVSCLFLCGLFCLVPFFVEGAVNEEIPTNNAPSDTLFFHVNNCADEVSICLDSLPLAEAILLSVMVNNSPYQKTLTGCSFDTISAYSYSTLFGKGDLGPYELIDWNVGDSVFTGYFNTIPDLVDSMNRWDPLGNWLLDESSESISGGYNGNNYSAMNVLVTSINTPSFIGYNFGLQANGTKLSFGVGIHNVSIFDSLNNTIRNAVVVISCVGKKSVENSVLIGETKTHCLDFSALLTAPKVVAFCDFLSQEQVDFHIIGDSCVSYSGTNVGVDTACIIVCDNFEYCDTTFLIITTYDVPHFRAFTINMEEGTQQNYCLDTTVLASPIIQFFNDCPTQSGDAADVLVDQTTFCTLISGVAPGTDTSCLVLCNQIGLCDTTYIYINVHPSPITEIVELIITEDESREICIETDELAGIVTGIDDFCKNNSSETVFFNINNVDLCFTLSAQGIGKDTACVVICDNFLICDTTFFYVTVESNTLSLTATPDTDSTSTNSSININILGNDSIPDGVITSLEIYAPNGEPINGTATTNSDGTLNYTPNQDFCGSSDEFGYIVCNSAGCDTTQVTVYIECVEPPSTAMKFYNGFSPNGDGKNDRFTIDGIAQYPNNELSVYNRWGIKVYGMRGYKNAWDGTWNEKRLPDGTYFYLLKDGVGKEYSGYLYIRR